MDDWTNCIEARDGFVYAIKWIDGSNMNSYKIGRTQMLGSEAKTIDCLLLRYGTYSLNEIEIYYKRVCNQVLAEKYLHDTLKNCRIRTNKEFFNCTEETLLQCFEDVSEIYPSLDRIIKMHTPEELTEINTILREIEDSCMSIQY